MKREDELKLIQDARIKLWHTYITWFTWHFAIHMTIIAGLLTIPALSGVDRKALIFIIAFAALGFGASIAMIVYQFQVRNRAHCLDDALSWSAFGGGLAEYARWATFATNLLLLAMWFWIYHFWPIGPNVGAGLG